VRSRFGKVWRRVKQVWITVGIGGTLVFVGWSLVAYRASPEGKEAARGDARVAIAHDDGVWTFTPAGGRAAGSAGLLFFPGALVDPRAYAPLARAAAEAGHLAVIVELPRRGAFGGAESPLPFSRAHAVMGMERGAERWVLAGHSRGAVVASELAAAEPARMGGLVLIGTSHPRDVDLAALAVPVTKIVGTRDGLASPPEVEANRRLLPASTRWLWIEGGNHSQFGWYGFQPGDRRATLPASEQRQRMTAAVLAALRLADAQPRPINEERP
jgi:predicted alpha/beta-hydrolase family hydrolase